MLWILKIIVHALFRIFFTLEYYGIENVPKTGAVVLACNHPTYLDPVLISLPIKRKIRFIAWDRLFKVPILGKILYFFGAFPVDITRPDSGAFNQAIEILKQGDALGIFPEARRSEEKKLNELVKTGAARFAIHQTCPLIPITITGAYDAWPASRLVPIPRKITVKFHSPIILDPQECNARREDKAFANQVIQMWRNKVEQRLLPAVKASDRLNQLFLKPAWPLRIYELVPAIAFFIILAAGIFQYSLLISTIAFYTYLISDIWFIPQSRVTKVLRDLAAPILFILLNSTIASIVFYPTTGVDFISLGAAISTLFIPLYYGNYYDLQRFIRGSILTYALSMVLEISLPSSYGLHASLFSFAIVYNLHRRPIHWYFSVTGILFYFGLFGYFAKPFVVELIYYVFLGIVVNLYMRFMKFTAHDGRTI